MDAATFIFEERTGDAGVEVVRGELCPALFVEPLLFVQEGVDDAGVAQGGEGSMKTLANDRHAVFGEGGEPVGEGFGFKEAERHHLAAAGATTGAAGDGPAQSGGIIADPLDDCIFKILDYGQKLGERGMARGQPDFGIEGSTADRKRKARLDRWWGRLEVGI